MVRNKRVGLNPLNYVGVTFSDTGKTLRHYGKEWRQVLYEKIDGSASYQVNVAQQYHGKGYNLAHWYNVYDWATNDGYNNFSDWVG